MIISVIWKPQKLRNSFLLMLALAYSLFFFVGSSVLYFSVIMLAFVMYMVFIQIMPHRMNYDYVIIHGCGLIGGNRISKLLSNRVDKAIEIFHRCNKKPMLIPSGGKGADEDISEAEAIRQYLIGLAYPVGWTSCCII